MKRVKQTAVFLLLAAASAALLMRTYGWHFTMEAVISAYEEGLHYGPSQSVLLEYSGEDGGVLVIGKVDDRTLSVIAAEPVWGVFWTGGNVPGLCSINEEEGRENWHIASACDNTFGLLYGLTDLPEAAVVRCRVVDAWCETPEDAVLGTFEMAVDEEGFFYAETGGSSEDETWYVARDITVFDADGNPIYTQETG